MEKPTIVVLYGLTRTLEIGPHKSKELDYRTWCKVKSTLHGLWRDGWATPSLFQGGIAYEITKPASLVKIEVSGGAIEVVDCPNGVMVEIYDRDSKTRELWMPEDCYAD